MLTVNDCAKLLGVTSNTVRVLIRQGRIKATLFGTQYAMDDAELQRYMGERRKPGRPHGTAAQKPTGEN